MSLSLQYDPPAAYAPLVDDAALALQSHLAELPVFQPPAVVPEDVGQKAGAPDPLATDSDDDHDMIEDIDSDSSASAVAAAVAPVTKKRKRIPDNETREQKIVRLERNRLLKNVRLARKATMVLKLSTGEPPAAAAAAVEADKIEIVDDNSDSEADESDSVLMAAAAASAPAVSAADAKKRAAQLAKNARARKRAVVLRAKAALAAAVAAAAASTGIIQLEPVTRAVVQTWNRLADISVPDQKNLACVHDDIRVVLDRVACVAYGSLWLTRDAFWAMYNFSL